MLLLLEYLMPEYEKNCLAEYVATEAEGKLVFQHHQQLSGYPQYVHTLTHLRTRSAPT